MRIRLEIARAVAVPALDFIRHVCRARERDAVDQRRYLCRGRRIGESLVCDAADDFMAVGSVRVRLRCDRAHDYQKQSELSFHSLVPSASTA